MNAIDIMEAAQSGKQVVPQFTPPSGLYFQSTKNPKEILDAKEALIDGSKITDWNNTTYDGNGWKKIKNEDLPSFADKKTQNMTMLYNAIEALKNRNFQEKMYGERYQKIIQDIKKAGLNPYAINFFSPGGISSGSAASIMSNYQASQSNVRSKADVKSQSKNENKNENKQNWGQFIIQAILGLFGIQAGLAGNALKAFAAAA